MTVSVVPNTDRPVRHAEPSDKATIPGTLSSKLAGVSFCDSYPRILHRLAREPSRILILVREPDNPHDANAVAVKVDGGAKVLGHLPKALAARIAPEIDSGWAWEVTGWEVLVQAGYEDRPGLTVSLRRAGA